MLDEIIAKKNKSESDLYELELKISEKDFFVAYDEIDKDSAYDLLRKYLIYKEDFGIPTDVETSYNNKEKLVTITSNLRYLDDNENERLR